MSTGMPSLPRSGTARQKDGVPGNIRKSGCIKVNQEIIDAFAAATGDDQWIHRIDSANLNPFGSPVAHGLLVLSLGITLARNCGALPRATWVLYAFDKLRFRAPVRSGTRIRCTVNDSHYRALGAHRLLDMRLVVEIADARVPALTANCSLLCLDHALDADGFR